MLESTKQAGTGSCVKQETIISRREDLTCILERSQHTHTSAWDSKRYSQTHASCCSSPCTPTSPQEEICYLLLITDWVIGRVKTAPTAYKRRPKPKPSQDPTFSSNVLSKYCIFERKDEFQTQECPMPPSGIISTGAPCNYLQPRPAWFGPCPPSPFPFTKATNIQERHNQHDQTVRSTLQFVTGPSLQLNTWMVTDSLGCSVAGRTAGQRAGEEAKGNEHLLIAHISGTVGYPVRAMNK